MMLDSRSAYVVSCVGRFNQHKRSAAMQELLSMVIYAWTSKGLRLSLARMELRAPSGLSAMYLREPAEYLARAIVAVNTLGE